MSELSYRKAGVDIEEGERFVRAIAPLVRKTFRPEVLSGIGSFGALFRLDVSRYRQPVLVSGADGVGTKLNVAFMAGVHNTVGIDLVAMCANDVLTSGAEPLFFLDYFATGKLSTEAAVEVLEGIAEGCREAGCSLIGGETAEMPGFYDPGEYDLSGFCVGVVDQEELVDGSGIEEGDVLLGLSSNGLHSNGYSLVRKVFFDLQGMDVADVIPELGAPLGKELLRPTRIYVKAVQELKKDCEIKGMAHITGGGIPGNIVRILPPGMDAVVREETWNIPPIFMILKDYGKLPDTEMRSTFNMGIGYILVVKRDNAEKALESLRQNMYDSFVMGEIVRGEGRVRYA